MIPNAVVSWITSNDFNDSNRDEVLNYLCLQSSLKSHDIKKRAELFLKGQTNLDRVSVEFVANYLGVSSRTFSRKLKKKNTCFQNLLDHERKRRCVYFLKNNVTSGAKISQYLGFSEPAYFYVTFKKWTKLSFSEFKNRMAENNIEIDHIINI